MYSNKDDAPENAARVKQNGAVEMVAADFETAIDAAGFGTFNILLLLVALPAAMSAVYETSTMSYIMPGAECDLRLTLLDKGILNAITYAGMITSAIAWGYIADTKGRKNVLVCGYLMESVCVICSAMSQNVLQLMVFKYLGGFISCGPFAVLMSYLTEMFSKKYRQRVIMSVGMMFSIATLSLPGLAIFILPNEVEYFVLGLKFSSWQIFLAISSLPCLLSGLFITFFPESPKFLMSQGRNAEALEVFRTIYAINKRKTKDTFTIKELLKEVPQKQTKVEISTIEIGMQATTTTTKPQPAPAKLNAYRKGLKQVGPLFRKPYLRLALQVYIMNFLLLLGQNTTRLWLPQLFASINEYKQKFGEVSSMCHILEYSVNKTLTLEKNDIEQCEVIITPSSYTNNIIVALSGFAGYVLVAAVVNRIGSKRILTIALCTAGIAGIALYFALSSLAVIISAAFYVSMGSISSTSVISSSANLFPTSLRTLVLSLAMMFGRVGSLLGNVLFPVFMSLGCVQPFLMISCVMLFTAVLSAFLPNGNKTALK